MFGEPTLIAQDVHVALHDALAPTWRSALAAFENARRAHDPAQFREAFGDADPELRTLLVATLDPYLVRVFLSGLHGQPGRALAETRGADFPDGGIALSAAMLDVLAGALAGVGEDAARLATRYADAVGRRGGFVIALDPNAGTIKTMLAAPGQDLSQALTLCDIGVTETLH